MSTRPVARRTVLLGAALAAMSGCSVRAAGPETKLRLATGPPGAVYREVGGAIAEALETHVPGAAVTTVPSRAATDNLGMLRAGDVDLGLSSLDAAVTADGEPREGITALGRIYDSHLHLVVLLGSPVRELSDLAGRRVSFGAEDSGTEFTARRLTDRAGLDLDAVLLDQAGSAHALKNGSIDAAFSLTGVPTPAILRLAEEYSLRIVPLPEAAELLSDAYPGPYAPAAIPATAYPRVSPAETVAVPNLLLAAAGLSHATARAVTGTVFGTAQGIGADHPAAAQINVRTGIATGPIPLHGGAQTWFREQKR